MAYMPSDALLLKLMPIFVFPGMAFATNDLMSGKAQVQAMPRSAKVSQEF